MAALGLSLGPSLALSLQSCAESRPNTDVPVYLDTAAYDTIWTISDLILPKTESPGAIDSGVPSFIDSLFGKYMEDEEKSSFQSGLEEFMTTCKKTYGKGFIALEAETQFSHLKELDAKGQEEAFFSKLKQIVLWAHFSSEIGMKSMNYKPVPGRYDGCIEIGPDEKNIVGNR